MKNQRTGMLAVCAAGMLAVPAFAGRPAAGAPTKLLRMPTVSATHIGFAYANNIWTVERAGGTARRLTSFHGQTTNPHFSPDGKWIAFSGEYAGNVDEEALRLLTLKPVERMMTEPPPPTHGQRKGGL